MRCVARIGRWRLTGHGPSDIRCWLNAHGGFRRPGALTPRTPPTSATGGERRGAAYAFARDTAALLAAVSPLSAARVAANGPAGGDPVRDHRCAGRVATGD